MLSPVLVPLHFECRHLCLSSLFQVWSLLQTVNAQDDSMADDRGDNLLFLHHRRMLGRPIYLWVHVSLA